MSKINKTILDHMVNSFPDETMTLDVVREILDDESHVYEKVTSRHRWYETTFRVVKINGMLIGYDSAHTTGDNSPEDVGWVFDPSSICEVESKEVVSTIYVKKA